MEAAALGTVEKHLKHEITLRTFALHGGAGAERATMRQIEKYPGAKWAIALWIVNMLRKCCLQLKPWTPKIAEDADKRTILCNQIKHLERDATAKDTEIERLRIHSGANYGAKILTILNAMTAVSVPDGETPDVPNWARGMWEWAKKRGFRRYAPDRPDNPVGSRDHALPGVKYEVNCVTTMSLTTWSKWFSSGRKVQRMQ